MASKKGTKTKSVEETFVKKSQIEHILDLPDTYIGSIEMTQLDTWILDENDERMTFRTVNYVPGLYKIFDEILVNALDQYVRLEQDASAENKVTQIKVSIDKERNVISVLNNGEGIPVVEHKDHKIYVPELLFGQVLTSSNYDKEEKKITGGKNGYGATCTNIFSSLMRIETVDASRKLKYIQEFRNNMSEKGVPQITKCSAKPYTKIEFSPDLARFNLTSLDNDTVQLMKKRVVDATACTGKTVNVFLNEKKLECKSLEKYVNYYLGEMTERVYDEGNDRWEVVVAVNPETKFDQVSFVNGITTLKGGKHVDSVVNSITKEIVNIASTKGIKRKKVEIKPADLKNNMFIFVRSTIENPSFDSQIKEYLTTPMTKFGSRYDPSEKFIEKLMKTSLIERAMKLTEFKDNLGLQKTSGTKSSKITGIPKLDDANKAGTDESHKCTLILTEGDSAKALAISGLSVVGRDYFGVFPLRGKLVNVRNMEKKRVATNEEIASLVKILGLKYSDKKRTSQETFKELRYGRVMIFTDSDYDGSHIQGLVINFFRYFWPELVDIPGFIITLATPVVKARKQKEVISFYTLTEYEAWKDAGNGSGWDIKYYKGLGTSTDKEAKEYFQKFDEDKIEFVMADLIQSAGAGGETAFNEEEYKQSEDRLELAFQKSREDDRKEWLKGYDHDMILEQTQKRVKYHEFIDRGLKHFSNYDNMRSIPSMCDGLKPSLRKILYACFKRNLRKDIRVSQLAGYISEKANYHHGEASLYEGIVGMAQNFVGSNNMELLAPSGMFGTRLVGGGDHASPRYIFTRLRDYASMIFNPKDAPLLQYCDDDDGNKVEPVYYMPIIPMLLVNGSVGIGTGFSTLVPPHHPMQIIQNLIRLMDGEEVVKMEPWFRGFVGEVSYKGITETGYEQYQNKGVYEVIDDSTLKITELPIGRWTSNYKAFLEGMMADKDESGKPNKYVISNISDNSTDKTVEFTVKFKRNGVAEMKDREQIEEVMKLTETKNCSYSNMHLYNSRGVISKYESVEDILREFYVIRLAYYIKRKEYMLKSMKEELDLNEAKIRFIREFMEGEIVIFKKEDDEITAQLEERGYPKFSSGNSKKAKKSEDEDEEDENEVEAIDTSMNYKYLMNMKIQSLTKRKMEELQAKYDRLLAEYNELMTKTEKDLWKDDLFELRDVIERNMRQYEEEMDEDRKSEKKEKKKTKKVTKKPMKN